LTTSKGELLNSLPRMSRSDRSESDRLLEMHWLFCVDDLSQPGFFLREDLKSQHDSLDFAKRGILEIIDIKQGPLLDQILDQFGSDFPTPDAFSRFARQVVGNIDPVHDEDGALMTWMNTEELLKNT